MKTTFSWVFNFKQKKWGAQKRHPQVITHYKDTHIMLDEYKELMKMGYEFDPVEKTFLVPHKLADNFTKPKGYEGWTIQTLIVDSYYTERMEQLGVTEDENKITLFGGANAQEGERTENKIFHFNKHGDIEITLYNLHRKPIVYASKPTTTGHNPTTRELEGVLTRYTPRREAIFGRKYDFDKSKTGNRVFWHPSLIEQYEEQEEVETLVLTEGYFKAFKATKEGIPTVGLPSITIFTEKKGADELHPEIIDFIHNCNVKNVVILWDADCRNISSTQLQEKADISRRPANFVLMAEKLQNLIRKQFTRKKLNIWFARIKDESEGILKGSKGLDDLLIDYDTEIKQIATELNEVDSVGYYFRKIDISNSTAIKNLWQDFRLDKVERFYEFHKEVIREQEFIYRNSTYEIIKEQPVLKIDANVKNYKIIGHDYYRVIKSPMIKNEQGDLEMVERLKPWTKTQIIDDHGKAVIKHIERYLAFTNVPSHTNYQRIVDNHWNLYNQVEHNIEPGQFPTIMGFMNHIFGEQLEYGLDYIKLLFEKPIQKLPILCLVSQEQETGKSTFIHLLHMIFQSNMTIITNNELESDFNSSWVDKLIVANEETVLEKRSTYEKVKFFSTTPTVERNEKNKSSESIPCYLKFIFCSNDEDTFLRMTDDDKRFWVRKVPSIPKDKYVTNFMEKMTDEIPYFLHFLLDREYSTERQTRMWFDTLELRTDAFAKVVKSSMPAVEKEIRSQLDRLFLDYSIPEVRMNSSDIRNYFNLKKYDNSYIEKVVTEKLGAERETGADGKTKVVRYKVYYEDQEELKMKQKTGRPFIFKKEEICKEIVEVDPNVELSNKSFLIDSDKDKNDLANEIINQ